MRGSPPARLRVALQPAAFPWRAPPLHARATPEPCARRSRPTPPSQGVPRPLPRSRPDSGGTRGPLAARRRSREAGDGSASAMGEFHRSLQHGPTTILVRSLMSRPQRSQRVRFGSTWTRCSVRRAGATVLSGRLRWRRRCSRANCLRAGRRSRALRCRCGTGQRRRRAATTTTGRCSPMAN